MEINVFYEFIIGILVKNNIDFYIDKNLNIVIPKTNAGRDDNMLVATSASADGIGGTIPIGGFPPRG